MPGRPRIAAPTSTAVALWGARVAWLAVAIGGGAAVGEALADRDRAVQLTGTAVAWVAWAAGAAGLAVAGVVTLTLVRTVVPASLIVAAMTVVGGASATNIALLAIPAIVATTLVASAELGRHYLQASAYGHELRFGLRPPLAYLLASVVTWMLAATAVVLAPLAWSAQAWAVAATATAVAAAGAVLLPRRWHQLSRRWLVFVPAGVVVHDPVVLADTLMVRTSTIASLDVVPAADRVAAAERAADLSGPTPGSGIEIHLREAATAVLAPRPSKPTGTAIHLTALVVTPTRPGAAAKAWRARDRPRR